MTLDKFRLENKNVLITGAAGLLGKEHASAILEVGGKVILTDVAKKKLEDTKKILSSQFNPNSILISKMDVTKKESIQKVSKDLSKSKIRVDVLINNAAINPKVGKKLNPAKKIRFENLSPEDWNLELDVGLKGAFLCSQIFGTKMAADSKGGIILNISSDLSVISPDQRIYQLKGVSEENQPVKPVTYSVIKNGLIGLTKYVATYWASKGVRCNALSPGGVLTDQDNEFIKKLNRLIPLGRMASKDEYRSTVQYLCSEASSYVNGQNIIVDGGRSIW
jgi:NAD(P)-dependent dehydrogenase (short-subunit alcohol dehydrogenase family)|tara:strand:+ start:14613 stop:15446 length:834 start_codon:yes stop_codon:yes gene_type:complete